MGTILTQEEIDVLMRAGLGKTKVSKPRTGAEGQSLFSEFPESDEEAAPGEGESGRDRPTWRRSPVREGKVRVQPAVFETFEDGEVMGDVTNLEIILNLELEIRVELGKTAATVRDVLQMGPGSVLELQKLNGEPVDLMVNQKPFSKGEMIVIGDHFGVRVTDILSVPEIIEALK
ncbi:MAG: FliM/FliN family flagellar motor switch protein [bacterium]